jgi:tRNA threonylcarbamoyladenosine biosynthesis protein TsaB
MKLLLINTCAAEGVVALADDGSVIAVERLPGRGSSEHLVPAVRRLMEAQGWRVRDLAAVAVVNGPGSFTGVRVGLSAAKGLCDASGVGLIAMSRLALLAGDRGEVVSLLDAGRGDYFCGVYEDGLRVSEQMLSGAAVLEIIHSRRAVTSEARVAESIGGGVNLVAEPGPEEIVAMATKRIRAGEWSDVASADANYLRRTDAELLVESGRV